MKHLLSTLSLGIITLLLANIAWAQQLPAAGAGEPQWQEVKKAQDNWTKALADKPPLVSLGAPPDYADAGARLADLLRDRLRLLGRKVFSNRAWRAYWVRQQERATTLAGLYRNQANKLIGPAKAAPQLKAEGLTKWAELAAEKVKNQDVYMKALGTERDAVEDRRAKIIDQQAAAEAAAKEIPPPAPSDPTPIDKWAQERDDILERIQFQDERKEIARVELKMVERQTESIGLMDQALKKDVELARLELEIATGQATSDDPDWVAVWQPFAAGSAEKVSKIEKELELGDRRRRGLMVEVEMAKSQITYREGKKTEFQEALGIKESWDSYWALSKDSAVDFITGRGWKLLLVLLMIYIALRIALRVIKMGTNAILKAFKDDDEGHVSIAEKRAETIKTVFAPVLKVAAYVIAILVALEQIGIDTGPLLGSVAILGLAISFGSQNLVRDLVNGFFILLENQFGVGDVVEIGGSAGVVENVNVRSTRLRQLDGTLRIIPNGEITNVANRTREWSRAVVHCGVGYGSDMAQVADIVNQIGAEMYAEDEWSSKLTEAPSFIGVTELGDSAVVFRCMAKTNPGEHWGTERELNRRLYEVLSEKGVEIPFPQRVVWQKTE